ncbi:hypothetical protein AB0J81_19735 [Streptomyces bobili]
MTAALAKPSAEMKARAAAIYPDSGHGGIFQYHEEFAPVAVEFLGR